MNNTKRITLSMASFGRKKGTIRAIDSILKQDINNWESLVIGDGCPVIQEFIDSNYYKDIQLECKKNGNDLIIENNPINRGGHGYFIINENIKRATGKYFVFFANDDILQPNHFSNYLSEIENTDYDFVYFNSWVTPRNAIRNTQLEYGMIGHSELIIRTEFLQQMPTHDEHYGHDWALITNMANSGKHKKATITEPTYYVMSLSDNREQGID
jgi:glycosyltransferase involved in cell wall biosynthesis